VAAGQEPTPLPNPPDLPDIGSPAAAMLNGTDEYQLGAMVIHQLRDQNAIIEDRRSPIPERTGREARDTGPRWRAHFQFFAVRDNAINAFCAAWRFHLYQRRADHPDSR